MAALDQQVPPQWGDGGLLHHHADPNAQPPPAALDGTIPPGDGPTSGQDPVAPNYSDWNPRSEAAYPHQLDPSLTRSPPPLALGAGGRIGLYAHPPPAAAGGDDGKGDGEGSNSAQRGRRGKPAPMNPNSVGAPVYGPSLSVIPSPGKPLFASDMLSPAIYTPDAGGANGASSGYNLQSYQAAAAAAMAASPYAAAAAAAQLQMYPQMAALYGAQMAPGMDGGYGVGGGASDMLSGGPMDMAGGMNEAAFSFMQAQQQQQAGAMQQQGSFGQGGGRGAGRGASGGRGGGRGAGGRGGALANGGGGAGEYRSYAQQQEAMAQHHNQQQQQQPHDGPDGFGGDYGQQYPAGGAPTSAGGRGRTRGRNGDADGATGSRGGRGGAAGAEGEGGRGGRGRGRGGRGAGASGGGGRGGASRIPRSPFLNLFHTNQTQWGIRDILGHAIELAKDQDGSRFIQRMFEESKDPEAVDQVFDEILEDPMALMVDVFGNYVVQKMLDVATPAQLGRIANKFRGNVMELTLHTFGCRVVQRAIHVFAREGLRTILDELRHHVAHCVQDQNGNHVIQKAIEQMPGDTDFVVDAFLGRVHEFATHAYGCRVIQCIFTHSPHRQDAVLAEIVDHCPTLAVDQFGNYVVQHVLEADADYEDSVAGIVTALTPRFYEFSTHKFASNVMEKVYRRSDPQGRSGILSTLESPSVPEDPRSATFLMLLMKDQFGNYVIQRILDHSTEAERTRVIDHIKPHLQELRRVTFGKHIVARIERAAAAEGEPRTTTGGKGGGGR